MSPYRIFLEGIGPLLQRRVEESAPSDIAHAYDRQIYLERREPLQDYSEFTVGHALETPVHSQAERAAHLRSLFDAATVAYSQAMLSAARGRGFANRMYALLGVVKVEEHEDIDEMPSLFGTVAWNSTRRGGTRQDLKIGFMPDEDPAHAHIWDEGGFLVDGDRGVYVHCTIREHHTSFSGLARYEYAIAISESIKRAAEIIAPIL